MMEARRIEAEGGAATWLLVFQSGDHVIAELEQWATANEVQGALFHAIGAVRRATVAWYDLDAQRYEEHTLDEQLEVCALHGNISRYDDAPRIHAHIVLGRRDLSTAGGHLVEAEVRPTLELVLTMIAGAERTWDEEVGLPLL